jgi:hypothetical protein
MNSKSIIVAKRALLDQADARVREDLAGHDEGTLWENFEVLMAEPERVLEQWEFAAWCVMRSLLEELQRREERGGPPA